MRKEEALVILGLSSTYTKDELKSAYRKLAKENHPDRGGSARLFDRIKKAYDFLSEMPIVSEVRLTHSSIFDINKK